jgi:hypothetical protein
MTADHIAKIDLSDKAPPSAKVSAAATLMKFGRESIELDDLSERIEKLEADAAARQPDGIDGGFGARKGEAA